MNIHHLEYFLEVARQGTFSKAAVALHITQPSISKMIKDMEDELGVTLFYRNSRQIELTDAGQALLIEAQQVVSRFQAIVHGMDDVINLKRGIVRIGLPPITSSSVLPRLLGEFSREHPQIQLHLFEFGSKKVRPGVQEGSLDIGIVCSLPTADEDFEAFPFINDPLRLILHHTHPLAQSPVVAFESLATESFVMYSQDFSLHDQIIERCRVSGFSPKILCETSQREFMTQMVAAGLGVALLPASICSGLSPASFVVVPLSDPQIYLQLAIIWRKDRYLSFAARRWLEFTMERCKDKFHA
jgi:DNA-binding transcriptional LysR family regulator